MVSAHSVPSIPGEPGGEVLPPLLVLSGQVAGTYDELAAQRSQALAMLPGRQQRPGTK